MVTATWNGSVIAKSDETIIIEGNHYFPPESVKQELLQASDKTSFCGWKGEANYKSIVLPDGTNKDAVWFYAEPKSKASQIKGYFAFWKGVKVDAADPGVDQTPDSVVCDAD